MAGLTDKQACFVQEYLIDLNATQAAIRAGYSQGTARCIGSENLGKPEIAQAIAVAQEERARRTHVTQDMIIRELARIGFSDLRKMMTDTGALIDPRDWDDDTAAAVSSLEIVTKPTRECDEDGEKLVSYIHKIKTWDKNSALDKLAKHLGMFVEKHEHTGKDGGPINVVSTAREKLAAHIGTTIATDAKRG